jgi:putative membrane protein
VQDDARRTSLANERTNLAWVRTGLAATAVAIGVGRIAPAVADAKHEWPYVAIGAGYALLGTALVAYGFTRSAEIGPDRWAAAILTIVGLVLGLATFALVVFA